MTKLIKNAKCYFYYLFCHGNEWACPKKYFIFRSQISKIKHLLKIKSANQCSLNIQILLVVKKRKEKKTEEEINK